MALPFIELPPHVALRVRLRRALLRGVVGRPAARRLLSRSHRAVWPELDEHVAAMLRLDELVNPSPFEAPAASRRRMRANVATADDAPEGAVETHDLACPGPGGSISLRTYATPGLVTPAPGVVFFHGGAFILGDLDTHDATCRRLALTGGVRVVAVDYRLAPEHPFPAPVDDALAAYRWIAAHASDLGLDGNRLAVSGDSAGGNLAAVVALRARGEPRAPALQALVYPMTDARAETASHERFARRLYLTRDAVTWCRRHYLGDDRALFVHPDVSPLLVGDVTGAPPALVLTADFDPLRDEGLAYAKRLADAGVPVAQRNAPHLIHGFMLMAGAAPRALAETERFARAVGESLRTGSLAPA